MMEYFRPPTAIEAISQELDRLQGEMNNYNFSETTPSDSPTIILYKNLLSQRETLQKALIDLAKTEAEQKRTVF